MSRHSSSDGTSIKSVKEASSWSTYCAKASIVYLGTTISQEWGLGIRKTRGSVWFERFQLARLNTPMKWRSLALMARWDYDDADGEEEEEDSARVWLNTRAVVILFTLRREQTSGARWGQSDAPKTWPILPRTGEPGSEKRIAMPRRASVHY